MNLMNPPPTDGPNTRYRLSQGLPPLSGTTAPYPSLSNEAAHPYEQYEEREAAERAAREREESSRNYIMSYEEWREWKAVTAHQPQSQQLSASQVSLPHLLWSARSRKLNVVLLQQSYSYEPPHSQQQHAPPPPPPTTSYLSDSSPQSAYFAVDPSTGFDGPSTAGSDYYYTPATEYASYQPTTTTTRTESYSTEFYPYSEPYTPGLPSQDQHHRDRVVSTSSVIDYGEEAEAVSFEQEAPPPPVVAPAVTMTKEEWLRMGGFVEEPATIKFHQQPQTSSTYSFPASTLAYDLPPVPASAPARSSFLFQPPPPPLHTPIPIRTRPMSGSTKSAPSPSPTKRRRAAPYPTSSSQSDAPPPPRPPPPPSSFATFDSIPLPSLPISLPPQSTSPKKSHSRKKSASHIPRPRNSFMLFRSHAYHSGMIPKDVGLVDHKNISKVIGDIWRNLESEEKKVWDLLAEKEKRDHREKYPDYKFQPKQKPKQPKFPTVKEDDSDDDSGAAPKAKPKPKRVRSPRKPAATSATSASEDLFIEERQPVRRTNRIRTKPANDSYAYSEDVDIDEEDEPTEATTGMEDDDDDDEDEDPPKKATTSAMQAGMSSWSAPAPWKSNVAVVNPSPKIEWTQERVAALANAVLEGVPDNEVNARVEEDLRRSNPASSPAQAEFPSVHSPTTFTLPSQPWPSASQPSSPQSTPPKSRSSLHQRAKLSNSGSKTSPASLIRSSPKSDTTASPPFKHSRLARRNSTHSSPGSASSTSGSPQRMGFSPSTKHPLSTSSLPPRSPPPPQPDFAPSPSHSHSSKESTYHNLGLSPSFSASLSPVSEAPSPFLHPSTSFDNSPLLGAGPDHRKLSLGRWELRQPSQRHVSRREMRAQEEEDELECGGGDGPGAFNDLARGFAGLDEIEEGFHHGEMDLFAAPQSIRSVLGHVGGGMGMGGGGGGEDADDEASTSYGGSEAFRF
ncbi:hypothetical protein RQP46_004361 [Phenoliferia psychrophenolica]